MTANLGAADEFEDGGAGGLTLFGITLTNRFLGIAIGAVGVIVAGYITFSQTNPQWQKLKTTRASIEQKERTVQSLEQLLASKANVGARVEDARQRNRSALSFLANDDILDTLLLDINAQIPDPRVVSNSLATIEFSGTLEKFEPGSRSETTGSQFSSRNFSLTFVSTYQDALDFIQRIERLRPLFVVKSVEMEPEDADIELSGNVELTSDQKDAILANFPPLLSVKFSLETYVGLSEADLQALELSDKEAAAAAAAAAATAAEEAQNSGGQPNNQ